MGFFSSFKKEENISEKNLPPPFPPLPEQGLMSQQNSPIPPPNFNQISAPEKNIDNKNISQNNTLAEKISEISSLTQNIKNENIPASIIPMPPQFNPTVDKNTFSSMPAPQFNVPSGNNFNASIPVPPQFNPENEKDTKINNNAETNNLAFQLTQPKNINQLDKEENKTSENQNISFSFWEKKTTNNIKEDYLKKINAPNALPILPPLNLHKLSSFDTKKTETRELGSFEIDDVPSFEVKEEEIKFEPLEKLPLIEIFDTEEPSLNFRYGISNKGTFEKKPLYIRTDHYSSVLTTIDAVKEYVTNSPVVIYNLENLKKNIDIENKRLKECIEDLQRKIIYVDKVLFERDNNG